MTTPAIATIERHNERPAAVWSAGGERYNEVSSGIADGPQSGILSQVTNGLAVRMAVLYLVTHT